MAFARRALAPILLLLGVVAVWAGSGAVPAAAQGLPQCTGQNQVQTAPYQCTRTRTIDGTTFTVVLSVTESGTATVTYTVDTPRPQDTPLIVKSHVGFSANPGNYVSGVLPAGATSATVVVPTIRCGQIDMKAVYVESGQAEGRVGAPYVTKPDNCVYSTTVPATTAPATTAPATTAPATTGPETTGPETTGSATTGPATTGPSETTVAATSTPATPPGSVGGEMPPQTGGAGTLPSTGSDASLAVVGAAALAAGVLALGAGRAVRPARRRR